MNSAQSALRIKLNEALIEAKLRNPAFSLRALSRRLELSPSALSEILNGKRRVSKKTASRVLKNLCLDPKETKALLSLFSPVGSEPTPSSSIEYVQLEADHFLLISDWFHFAILSLAETDDFNDLPHAIAHRLGITAAQAESAIDRLVRLQLLSRDKKGSLRPTGRSYSTSDEIRSIALKKAHLQNLELSTKSLEQDPIEVRDFTAMTMAIDSQKLPQAKKMIREFQDKLSAYLESGRKNEVYKITVQLFPLTVSKRAFP